MQRSLFISCQFKKNVIIKNLIIPIAVVIFSFAACKKENVAPIITATGELIDGGSPALDGTGFFIRLQNNEELKPEVLPDSLQVAGIRASVELTYQHTGRQFSILCSTCPGMPIIRIINIRRI